MASNKNQPNTGNTGRTGNNDPNQTQNQGTNLNQPGTKRQGAESTQSEDKDRQPGTQRRGAEETQMGDRQQQGTRRPEDQLGRSNEDRSNTGRTTNEADTSAGEEHEDTRTNRPQ
jgi:hypothetical protein